MGLEVSSFHFVCSSLIIIDNCSSSSLVLNLKLSPTYHKLEIRHFLPYGTPPHSPPPPPLSIKHRGCKRKLFIYSCYCSRLIYYFHWYLKSISLQCWSPYTTEKTLAGKQISPIYVCLIFLAKIAKNKKKKFSFEIRSSTSFFVILKVFTLKYSFSSFSSWPWSRCIVQTFWYELMYNRELA